MSQEETKDGIQEEGWVEKMLRLYSEGMTDVEVCKEMQITRRKFEEYCSNSPEFKAIVEAGRDYAEAFWVSQPRKNLQNKNFMTEAWKFYMANRYAWGTKQEVKEKLSDYDLDKIREELRKRYGALGQALNVIDMETVRKGIAKE